MLLFKITLTKIDHKLDHKTNLNKFQRTKIMEKKMICNHGETKLEIDDDDDIEYMTSSHKTLTHY